MSRQILIQSGEINVTISKETIDDGVNSVNVTVSIGATLVAPEDRNFEAVMSLADNALYRSKLEGRNRVTMA